jgi:hypothetical protein
MGAVRGRRRAVDATPSLLGLLPAVAHAPPPPQPTKEQANATRQQDTLRDPLANEERERVLLDGGAARADADARRPSRWAEALAAECPLGLPPHAHPAQRVHVTWGGLTTEEPRCVAAPWEGVAGERTTHAWRMVELCGWWETRFEVIR